MDFSFSDEQIERYVRFPETLPSETRQAIEEEIERNPVLREVVTFFTEFYKEMDAGSEEESPKVQSLLDRLFPKDAPGGGESG